MTGYTIMGERSLPMVELTGYTITGERSVPAVGMTRVKGLLCLTTNNTVEKILSLCNSRLIMGLKREIQSRLSKDLKPLAKANGNAMDFH